MTVGAFQLYEKAALKIAQNDLDFETDTITAALLVHGHTVDLTDEFVSEVTANECADADYARKTVGSKTLAIIGTGTAAARVRLDCADVIFGPNVTIGARYLVFFKNTGNDATSPLIGIVDLRTENDGNVQSNNDDFTYTVSASGLYEWDAN